MLLGLLVSGALSNVAAAVLLTAVVAPVARELTDSEAKRAILGVAFGCTNGYSQVRFSVGVFFRLFIRRSSKVSEGDLEFFQGVFEGLDLGFARVRNVR